MSSGGKWTSEPLPTARPGLDDRSRTSSGRGKESTETLILAERQGFHRKVGTEVHSPPASPSCCACSVEAHSFHLDARTVLALNPVHRQFHRGHRRHLREASQFVTMWSAGRLCGRLSFYNAGELFFGRGESANFRRHADDEANNSGFEQIPLRQAARQVQGRGTVEV